MKFMFCGHLFRLFKNYMTIVTPYGDKYKIILNDNTDIPFTIVKLKIRNPNEDHEQLVFEKELKYEDVI